MSISGTLEAVVELVGTGAVHVSDHGYTELSEDSLSTREIVEGVGDAVVVEDYPGFPKGPCVLVLQSDSKGLPVHVVWGIPKGHDGPAVLVTAYRPDAGRWSSDFLRRLE